MESGPGPSRDGSKRCIAESKGAPTAFRHDSGSVRDRVSVSSDRSIHHPPEFKERSSDWSIHHPPEFKERSSDRSIHHPPEFKDRSSDWSIHHPPEFKEQSSDRSIHHPPEFKEQSSDRSIHHPPEFKERSSDWSIHHPPEFKERSSDWSIHHPPEFKERSSDWSIHHPPEFKDRSSDWSIHHPPEFKERSSDRSIHHPPEFKKDSCLRDTETEVGLGQEPQRELDIIFKRLEENILRFVKQQLHRLHRLLDPDFPECSESEEEEQSSKEAVLIITMDFLKRMNQTQLAQHLQNYTAAGVCRGEMKRHLQQKFQYVSEGVAKAGNSTLLNQIYTELYITEGGASEVNQEHEVRLMESASWKQSETRIACEDMFKCPAHTQEPIRAEKAEAQEPIRTKRDGKEQIRSKLEEGQTSFKSRLENALIKPTKTKSKKTNGPIRVVLTKGVAGVGKTVLTQKFSLDWAEGRAHQELQLLFPFTFRELNVLRDSQFSLVELLHHFFSPSKRLFLQQLQVLFILDGLDECRLPLDFRRTRVLTDPTESVSVDVLLVNLIRGSLLPSALLWITTRPAAANQIPAECVSMVTEVRGFTDPQKEEYFKKRFRDDTIISHIKRISSLHIMCHMPVFCWILSTVIQKLLEQTERPELPRTLTQMYVHFLVVQAKVQNIKYLQGSGEDPHWTPETREMVESLGKLAFEQLQKGNLIFYESDLSECGLDAAAASVYSGVFTQVFREEPGLYQDKVYCFIHLSVQEFLAALHVHQTFFSSGQNLLSSSDTPEENLYRSAVDQALWSPNGHLDLFLRFLLGLSLPTNQRPLQGLLTQTASNSQTKQDIVKFIKTWLHSSYSHRDYYSSTEEKSLNLFHCLNELNDHSLLEEIQQYTREGDLAQYTLTSAHFSALCILIQSSSSDLNEFDLRKYHPSENALLQLLPVVKASTKALLSACGLSPRCCGPLASVLSSSSLTHLDLSHNNLQDSGVELLCSELKSAPCRLQTLSLRECNLTEHSCGPLASVLTSSSLTHLDLSYNDLQDSGVELLCSELKSTPYRLQTLRLSLCGLSPHSCGPLASVLSSSSLTHLDLSHNDLQDSGVELLCSGLKSAPCRLETLRLSGCLVSQKGGASLASALSSAPSHLRELDLTYNHPGPSAELLTALRDDPHCPLQSVRLDPVGKEWMVPGPRKYSCKLSLDPNTAHGELFLSNHNQTVNRGLRDLPFPYHEDRFRDYPQVLTSTGLRGCCYWEVDWKGDWGDVHIAASHGGIKRRGASKDIVFGRNSQSWSLCVFKQGYRLHHNNTVTDYIPLHPEREGYSYGRGRVSAAKVLTDNAVGCPSGRVGVFLDSEAGCLSFYEVLSGEKLSHIYTYSSSFTEPVFAGLWLGSLCSSVSLVSRYAKLKEIMETNKN